MWNSATKAMALLTNIARTISSWVRGAYPGYAGARPRVAIWHGTSDTTVAPANATELRDQGTYGYARRAGKGRAAALAAFGAGS